MNRHMYRDHLKLGIAEIPAPALSMPLTGIAATLISDISSTTIEFSFDSFLERRVNPAL